MKMKMEMTRDSSDEIRIYDIVAHKTYRVDKRDINITKTKLNWWNIWWNGYSVHVHSWAYDKTPKKCGYFIVSEAVRERLISSPRKSW